MQITAAHPLASSPRGESSVWDRSWSAPVLLTEDLDNKPVLAALQQLAAQGLWREVANRCRSTTTSDTATALSVATYRVLALIKLRLYPEAASEIGKLGDDLDDPAFLRSGAPLAPFALRWLHADLPALAGQQGESVARFQALLSWCKSRTALAEALNGRLATWRRRRSAVARALACRLCRVRHHRAALAVLNELLQQDGTDWQAWTQAGLIQAQLGDLTAARATFERVAHASAEQPGASGELAARRRKGLLLLLRGDYSGAAGELRGVLQRDPGDTIAASNLALCHLYACNLAEAVATLEGAFRAAPEVMLQEPIVTNLASTYELGAAADSQELKRSMAQWVVASAPDDFDLACTKAMGT